MIYFMVILTWCDGRSTSVPIDNVISQTCQTDLTLNRLFMTQDKRHEQGTSISSIQFFHYAPVSFKIIRFKTDWLTGWKWMAEADGTVTLHYYISINNADTRPMVLVSKLTERRFGSVLFLEGQAFILSSFPPEQLWPLKSTEASWNASAARFPVCLALFHLTF